MLKEWYVTFCFFSLAVVCCVFSIPVFTTTTLHKMMQINSFIQIMRVVYDRLCFFFYCKETLYTTLLEGL